MLDLEALKKVADEMDPEEWSLNKGLGGHPQERKDVKRLGWFVYTPHWGAVAATPKDSPQFSRHGTLMTFIATFDPATVKSMLAEIEECRAQASEKRDRE